MKIRNHSVVTLILCFTLAVPVRSAYAYVLPYPSFMPGNKMYSIMRLYDTAKKYWSFGNIASIKYYLSLSDKYLVESRILAEYKQYLLADEALVRSTEAFSKLEQYLHDADKEGKNIDTVSDTVRDAAYEHLRVLDIIEKSVPSEVSWNPEKSASTHIQFGDHIAKAVAVRLKFSTL